jgi:hypothetical protein
VSWQRVSAPTADRATLALELPPGWWPLPVRADDLDDQLEQLVEHRFPAATQPGPHETLAAECRRVARICATVGVGLAAFGSAYDEAAGQVVTATLLVLPSHLAQRGNSPDRTGPIGPVSTMETSAGSVRRQPKLTKVAGPGAEPNTRAEYVGLQIDYTVERWTLSFTTLALRHLHQLLPVFDSVVGTFELPSPAVAGGG